MTVGPDLRRGLADLDGNGEAVSGIVVMRQGQNAVDVIDRVKARIQQIALGMPPGMEIVPIYDRSALIRRAIDNVSETLVEVVLTVSLVGANGSALSSSKSISPSRASCMGATRQTRWSRPTSPRSPAT